MLADATTRAEIVAVLDRLAEVYVTRDADALASIFVPDPDVVVFSPGAQRSTGLDAIQAKAVDDWGRTDAATLRYASITASTAGSVAWVAADADFTVSAGDQQTTTPVRITFVLEERGGRWLIVHAHYSLAPAVAEQVAPALRARRPTTRRHS